MNLVEALQAAIAKGREHIAELEEVAKLTGHGSADEDPGLRVSKTVTEALIRETEAAIASGDVVEMLRVANLNGIGGDPDA